MYIHTQNTIGRLSFSFYFPGKFLPDSRRKKLNNLNLVLRTLLVDTLFLRSRGPEISGLFIYFK